MGRWRTLEEMTPSVAYLHDLAERESVEGDGGSFLTGFRLGTTLAIEDLSAARRILEELWTNVRQGLDLPPDEVALADQETADDVRALRDGLPKLS